MRIVKTILDVKGMKRFKHESGQKSIDVVKDGSVFGSAGAREKFRKMTYQTSYCTQFGNPPKAAEDYLVLKNQKKFSNQDIATFIQPMAK